MIQRRRRRLTLGIDGHLCPDCSRDLIRDLEALPGVARVMIAPAGDTLVVDIRPGGIGDEDLALFIRTAGHRIDRTDIGARPDVPAGPRPLD